MQDRRQHYRVQAEYAKDVSIDLTVGRKTYGVRAKDLSAGGAGLLVPLSLRPLFKSGTTVTLDFSAPWCKSIRISGKVIRAKVHEETQLEIGVVFTDWEERRDSLGHRLRRIFNERKVLRVKTPPGESNLGMVSLGTGETQRLEIEDIGVYGAMISGLINLEVELDQQGTLTIDIGSGPVSLPCRVRHVQVMTQYDPVMFGLHFYALESMSKHFEQQLIDYVFELQREELRGLQKGNGD